MTDRGNEIGAPVFILCTSRSGSTLLRYILNAHPRVVCPPELHFVPAAQRMVNIFANTVFLDAARTAQERAELAVDRVAEIFTSIMREYCESKGATIWCEKSVSSVDLIELLQRMFAGARFVCLYRNALDQLVSGLDALEINPEGNAFGYTPYLQRTHPNRHNGLADYWIDKNSAILAFERANPGICLRLRYEDMVLETDVTLGRLFEFIGLEWRGEYAEEIFTIEQNDVPGDWKIRNTTAIQSTSIGRHDAGVIRRLDSDRIASINELHGNLGYDPVGQ